MPQLFQESGDLSSVEVVAPTLRGLFVPSIDKTLYDNSLGLVTPWGSGPTARSYLDYGTSVASSSYDSLLNDLNSAFLGGGSIKYDIGGLAGPQGPRGPQGPPGITTIQQVVVGATGDLSSILKQLEGWDAAEDTLPYGAAEHIVWEEAWTKMDVAAISSWNDAAIDHDGSFMLVASDAGIHVSTDIGATWAFETVSPAEGFLSVGISDASGNAVALGKATRNYGTYWKSENSGETWAKVTIST